MTQQTLLAAVFAAANEPASDQAAASTSQTQENPVADMQNGSAVPAKITTVAEMRAAYPDLCTELSNAAAGAERARIMAIDDLDAKGHDQIVASAKADGKSDARDVALAINMAEKRARGLQLANIQDVEAAAAAVKPDASAGGHDQPQVANTPEGWKSEFAKSADLQAEFSGSVDAYVAFKQGEADGRVRRLFTKSA